MLQHLPGLTGVIACGGESSRMGRDKCFLNYHGEPQCYFLYHLLKPICKNVFISCNESQSSKFSQEYNLIVDKEEFKNHGPVSGLLSSFSENEKNSILYIGCDYPFIDENVINTIVNSRNQELDAITFRNENNYYEPLICIYENVCYPELLNYFYQDNFSLRVFLEKINTLSLIPENANVLKGIDTPEEYQKTIFYLNK